LPSIPLEELSKPQDRLGREDATLLVARYRRRAAAESLKTWSQKKDMRVYINRLLDRFEFDTVWAKRKWYDRAAQDASRWLRVRPLVCANTQVPTHADEFFAAMRDVDELRSQFGQDAFVLARLLFKKGGYFVDFGATDGVTGNNSYILEKRYGWKGILAEPARCWHEALQRNRQANVELSCVAATSGQTIPFHEKGVFSSMRSQLSLGRRLKQLTKPRRFYDVPTISLLDLLKKHRAPRVIDYLSMDTEGSELEILSAFDFSAYRFRVITCEHNYKPNREKIFALLSSHGYDRVFQSISEADDWYVARDVSEVPG
jgi:FkbM family methyltransferase